MKTIPYMGSKKVLLPFIEDSIKDYTRLSEGNFLDAFSGSGRVAHHFRNIFNVTANDMQAYSKIINEAYLLDVESPEKLRVIIDELNNLDESYFDVTDGWYTENYGGKYNNNSTIDSRKNRRPWIDYNARKIDMIRHRIDELYPKDCTEKSVLLTSLLVGVVGITNAMGHVNGYLKAWAPSKLKKLKLEMMPIDIQQKNKHTVLQKNVIDLDKNLEYDIVYVDPPYGSNNTKLSISGTTRYSAFYHLWNTIIMNNKPEIWGKAGKPCSIKGKMGTDELEYNVKDVVIPATTKYMKAFNTKYLAFSYSNKGLMSKQDLLNIFEDSGYDSVKLYTKNHKTNSHAKAVLKDGSNIQRKNHNEPLKEYLFLMKKHRS
jgi:adenine-specific DNA-methyltransferase